MLMTNSWNYDELVNGDGRVIRRDEVTVTFPIRDAEVSVQATEDEDTYQLVNTQGQVLNTFTVTTPPEVTISKNEPMVGTFTIGTSTNDRSGFATGFISGWVVTEPERPRYSLPDGEFTERNPGRCQCLVCRTAREEIMDRNQVARVAAEIGSSLMPDNSQWVNRFTVESSSSSRVYTVAQRRSDNVWGCSCPAWINRRHCKHLDNILERLAKLTAFDVTDPAVLEMLRSARTAYLDLDTPVDGRTQFPAKLVNPVRQLDL